MLNSLYKKKQYWLKVFPFKIFSILLAVHNKKPKNVLKIVNYMCNELVTDIIIIKNYRKLCKYKTDGCLFLYLKFFGFFFQYLPKNCIKLQR